MNTCVKGKHRGKILFVNTFNRNKHCWILYSRAFDHVSYFLDNFLSFDVVEPIIVKLLMENMLTLLVKEMLKLVENCVAYPNFDYNLIYFYQLTSSHNLRLIFFSKTCIIHDYTKERIGVVDVVCYMFR